MTETSHQCGDMDAMRALAPQHRQLAAFAGRYKAVVQMWMGPGEPMRMTGVMVNDLDLGGRYLRQTYTGDPFPGHDERFEGRGYWGFNTIDQRFEGFWIDTASTFFQLERGQVDPSGKVWTMIGEMTNPGTGEPMRKRSVITLKDANHHSIEMFFEGPNGSWNKSMQIEYSRA